MSEWMPKILGFCAGLAVLGGVIAGVVMWGIGKHMDTLKELADLKGGETAGAIDAVKVDLKHDISMLELKFKTLSDEVKNALGVQEAALGEQRRLYSKVTAAVLRGQQSAERRFTSFQESLAEVKVFCDRLKKQ